MTLDLDAQKKDEKLLLATIQQEYKILAEYKMIESEKLSGIYVIPSYANSLQWFGVFFGRHGFYEKSVFRFSILLSDGFPDDKSVPAIVFQHNVVHPLVCPYTYSLDLSHAFHEWRPAEDHLWQVLKYMQAIFADPLESIRNVSTVHERSNAEIIKLLNNNRDAYAALVQESILESKAHIYDNPHTEDPHYIIFEKFQDDIHGPVLEQIRQNRATVGSTESGGGGGAATGLSWVKFKEGEFKPLSIE
ncbi:protein crossbronx [Drosophila grimshawi]|uniref:Protein crossbronx n=1 Tax=Drosophila grimshawi TaxID=7222 RepID=AKTP1_DROGR|nr:protein crossbronx [Drosophila grimshawi]B4J613.1 RecName: Full=Protein crossbronx [Drosophila grimshawi]EDW01871.1 GH20212 [Drosophila grimshawi]